MSSKATLCVLVILVVVLALSVQPSSAGRHKKRVIIKVPTKVKHVYHHRTKIIHVHKVKHKPPELHVVHVPVYQKPTTVIKKHKHDFGSWNGGGKHKGWNEAPESWEEDYSWEEPEPPKKKKKKTHWHQKYPKSGRELIPHHKRGAQREQEHSWEEIAEEPQLHYEGGESGEWKFEDAGEGGGWSQEVAEGKAEGSRWKLQVRPPPGGQNLKQRLREENTGIEWKNQPEVRHQFQQTHFLSEEDVPIQESHRPPRAHRPTEEHLGYSRWKKEPIREVAEEVLPEHGTRDDYRWISFSSRDAAIVAPHRGQGATTRRELTQKEGASETQTYHDTSKRLNSGRYEEHRIGGQMDEEPVENFFGGITHRDIAHRGSFQGSHIGTAVPVQSSRIHGGHDLSGSTRGDYSQSGTTHFGNLFNRMVHSGLGQSDRFQSQSTYLGPTRSGSELSDHAHSSTTLSNVFSGPTLGGAILADGMDNVRLNSYHKHSDPNYSNSVHSGTIQNGNIFGDLAQRGLSNDGHTQNQFIHSSRTHSIPSGSLRGDRVYTDTSYTGNTFRGIDHGGIVHRGGISPDTHNGAIHNGGRVNGEHFFVGRGLTGRYHREANHGSGTVHSENTRSGNVQNGSSRVLSSHNTGNGGDLIEHEDKQMENNHRGGTYNSHAQIESNKRGFTHSNVNQSSHNHVAGIRGSTTFADTAHRDGSGWDPTSEPSKISSLKNYFEPTRQLYAQIVGGWSPPGGDHSLPYFESTRYSPTMAPVTVATPPLGVDNKTVWRMNTSMGNKGATSYSVQVMQFGNDTKKHIFNTVHNSA